MQLTRRQLLLGLGGATIAAGTGGYGLWRWRRGPELRALSLGELGERAFDVCVIGSGPAGAVLAGELLERGLRVLVLESGVPVEQTAALGWNPAALDVYEMDGDPPYPLQATRLRALGGSSNLWTGRCSRLHPLDFENNAYTPPDNPWPIRYADLEAYYARAEQTLDVRGGALSEYHAPRRKQLPRGEDEHLDDLRGALADLDLTLDPSPTSHAPRWRSGPLRSGRDLLPAFAESRLGALVTDATVVRLDADASGRVTGADVRSTRGERRSVRAEIFVVACGALESVRLLLLSRSAQHPVGLGNAGDQLGRGFNEHPNLSFTGELPEETPGGALARSHQLYDAAKQAGLGSAIYVFTTSSRQPHFLAIGATLEMFPDPENRLTLAPAARDAFGSPGLRLSWRFSPQDRATLAATRENIAKLYERLAATQVEERSLSWSHHHIGGCRMGADPATSVVDPNLRVHGSANLHVLSSAVFVTGGAAHPTLAIVALAHRLADHLAPA